MHLPDHVLAPSTAVGTAVLSTAILGYGLQRARTDSRTPTLAALAATTACIFAAQMLNFPISPGISGHVLGGVWAALLLGPWMAMLAMTVVIVAQCFLFQDGGVTSLGANLLNMAIVAPLAGHFLFALLRRQWSGNIGAIASAAIASWFSVQCAALLCSLELAFAGHSLANAMRAMLASHTLIGLGESFATGASLAMLIAMRPELLSTDSPEPKTPATEFATTYRPLFGLLAALAMAVILAPFASALPDGLESALTSLGFQSEGAPVLAAPFANYEIAALNGSFFAVSLAGALGTMTVAGVACMLALAAPPKSELPGV